MLPCELPAALSPFPLNSLLCNDLLCDQLQCKESYKGAGIAIFAKRRRLVLFARVLGMKTILSKARIRAKSGPDRQYRSYRPLTWGDDSTQPTDLGVRSLE